MGKTELEGIIKVSDKLIHSTNIDSNSGGQKQTVSSLMKLFTSPKQSSKDNPGSEENTLSLYTSLNSSHRSCNTSFYLLVLDG